MSEEKKKNTRYRENDEFIKSASVIYILIQLWWGAIEADVLALFFRTMNL